MTECRFKSVLEAYPPKRENLVSVLQDIQEKDGFISPEAVKECAEYFSVSEADVYSVASFYAQFKFKKPGKHTIKVCKERVACLGACALAPAMVVDEKVHARVTLAEIEKILKSLK